MTYDIESLLLDVKSILVANLNAKIDAIENEKIASGAVSTGLKPIDVNIGYFEQSWADNTLNISPALFYGVENIPATGIGPATETHVKLFCAVVIPEIGDKLAKNRIHRYTRALKEVFEEHYAELQIASQIKLETLLPVSFKFDENSSETMKIGGVSILTAFA